jgi:hypothetical protein
MADVNVSRPFSTSARRPASVIRTRASSIVRPPATTRSACAVPNPTADQLDHLLGCEAMRQHDRLRAAVAAGGKQFERAVASGGRDALARVAARVFHRGRCTCLRDGDARGEPRWSSNVPHDQSIGRRVGLLQAVLRGVQRGGVTADPAPAPRRCGRRRWPTRGSRSRCRWRWRFARW